MNQTHKFANFIIVVFASLILVSCGGGDGTSTADYAGSAEGVWFASDDNKNEYTLTVLNDKTAYLYMTPSSGEGRVFTGDMNSISGNIDGDLSGDVNNVGYSINLKSQKDYKKQMYINAILTFPDALVGNGKLVSEKQFTVTFDFNSEFNRLYNVSKFSGAYSFENSSFTILNKFKDNISGTIAGCDFKGNLENYLYTNVMIAELAITGGTAKNCAGQVDLKFRGIAIYLIENAGDSIMLIADAYKEGTKEEDGSTKYVRTSGRLQGIFIKE